MPTFHKLASLAVFAILGCIFPQLTVDCASIPRLNNAAADIPYPLPQRLVRRNFLRFGKRADSGTSAENAAHTSGEDEVFESTVMASPMHKSSPRSFLRFGRSSGKSGNSYRNGYLKSRRSDNFLRFGKRGIPDPADYIVEANDEAPAESTNQDDCYLLSSSQEAVMCWLRSHSFEGQKVKRANKDFLRFG